MAYDEDCWLVRGLAGAGAGFDVYFLRLSFVSDGGHYSTLHKRNEALFAGEAKQARHSFIIHRTIVRLWSRGAIQH